MHIGYEFKLDIFLLSLFRFVNYLFSFAINTY